MTMATIPPAYLVPTEEDEIEPPTGDEILHFTRMYLDQMVVWPNQATLDTVCLWIAHTHARRANGMLIWQASPRLLFQSAEPGSGKSHAMKHTSRLCPDAVIYTEPSEAAVAYSVGEEHATLFLEEADELFGSGGKHRSLRAIANDGYTPDGMWPRVRRGVVVKLPTFGALALAGLDKLETATGGAMTAFLTRTIRVKMRRAPAGDQPPRDGSQARMVAARICGALAEWVGRSLETLETAEPVMPEGIGNRDADLWTPLLAIADEAGGRWPHAARKACLRLTSSGLSPEDTAEALDELAELTSGWSKLPALKVAELAAGAPGQPAVPAAGPGYLTDAQKVLAALKASPKAMRIPDLIEQTGVKNVRTALDVLKKRGECVNVARGWWASAEAVASQEVA